MALTVADFTHFAVHGSYIYIYKTPDSTDYTITVFGLRKTEEVTDDGSRFEKTDPDLRWGIVFKALQHIAEANGAEKEADRFESKSFRKMSDAHARSEKRNYHLDKVDPYNLSW